MLGLATLELPWLDNAKGKSCIPTGEFMMWFGPSRRFKDNRWHVEVPGRTGILFHRGVFLRHSLGCIMVGVENAIESSMNQFFLIGAEIAYPRFLNALKNQRWNLKVVEGGQ